MDSTPDPTASNSDSDTESTTSIPPQSQPHHIHSPSSAQKEKQKQSICIFPLAHPPPTTNPTHRLRLTPKLLLQIQHLSQRSKSTRPLPVLEVWLPSRFAGRLGVGGNLPKLRAGDVYITLSEGYTSLSGDSHDHGSGGEGEEEVAGTGAQEGAVVGVIYHTHAQTPKSKSKKEEEEGLALAQAKVHFPLSGRTWIASATPSGGYLFQIQGRDGGGSHVLEWKRRGSGTGKGERSRSTSTSFSSMSTDAAAAPGGECRFVLGIVDVRTRRGARVASLTRRGFEVGCWERLPREGLQECVVASDSSKGGAETELSEGQLRTAVYTMVLTMGVWVALQEGWLG